MFPIVDDQGLLLKLEGGKIWLLEVSLKSPLFLLSGFFFFSSIKANVHFCPRKQSGIPEPSRSPHQGLLWVVL